MDSHMDKDVKLMVSLGYGRQAYGNTRGQCGRGLLRDANDTVWILLLENKDTYDGPGGFD